MLLLYIKNASQLLFDGLNSNLLTLREIGLNVLEISISAVKPKNIIEKSLKFQNGKLFIQNDEYDLHKFRKIYVIGGGKATAEMSLALERILVNMKDIDYEGIINIPENSEIPENLKESKITINFASHPIPNENGLNGTKSMIDIVKNSTEKDLFFCLISGGGSALLPLPKQGIKLEELQKVNSLLLSSGASIHEINTIRKHLSDFKGGNLVKQLYNSSGATLISLIISDVVGDYLDSIASGPTVPDKSTFEDALEIIKKYELLEEIPNSVKEHLEKGLLDKTLENPKPDDVCFTNIHNYLIGSVSLAAQEVKAFLIERGFEVKYFSNNIIGEAKEFGKTVYNITTQDGIERLDKYKIEKIALIGTGELTVTVKGTGIGGRNQEMLLSFLNNVKDKNFDNNFLIIGANLDGIEGNSKAMGALVDNYVLEQMVFKKIDPGKYLENNDSNRFFQKLGVELITGSTGCNVNDIILILLSRKIKI